LAKEKRQKSCSKNFGQIDYRMNTPATQLFDRATPVPPLFDRATPINRPMNTPTTQLFDRATPVNRPTGPPPPRLRSASGDQGTNLERNQVLNYQTLLIPSKS